MRRWSWLLLALLAVSPAAAGVRPASDGPADWQIGLLLFAVCLVIGVVAVIAGVGGGVLYVPLISAVSPFHLDFVRGAGLLCALAGSTASVPRLLERRLASLHLVLPCAVLTSLGAILGARVGLRLPSAWIEALLGLVILLIATVMARTNLRTGDHAAHEPGPVAARLSMTGEFTDQGNGEAVRWHAWHARWGLPLSFGIGLIGGMFGVGAGWANVPLFLLVMGVPLKVASAGSVLLISFASVAASWVYLLDGSVLPQIAVPSMLGLMLGSRLGARLLDRAPTERVRRVVLAVLVIAGCRLLWTGVAELMGGGA